MLFCKNEDCENNFLAVMVDLKMGQMKSPLRPPHSKTSLSILGLKFKIGHKVGAHGWAKITIFLNLIIFSLSCCQNLIFDDRRLKCMKFWKTLNFQCP